MENLENVLQSFQDDWKDVKNQNLNQIRAIKVFKDGEFISDFLTAKKASDYCGVSKEHILGICHGKSKTGNGYWFVFRDKWNGETKPTQRRKLTERIKWQIEVFKDDISLGVYFGAWDVIKTYGINPSYLSKIRRGLKKSWKGHTFVFTEIKK
jgi:hypothetical protein